MSFARIRDQEVAVRLLRNVLGSNRVPNGLLFWGPSGVGKRLAAIEFAKALNCPEGQGEACDACLSCRRIENRNHPDFKEIVPADRSCEIKKRQIDEITELASLRPFESQSRFFLIQDADRMNPSAQNHFLKTLEEPPGPSVFVLVTEYPRVLLPTIRSRCQAVRFRTLKPDTVRELLQRERDLPEEQACAIAGLAQGQMARALDLVDSERRDVVLAIVQRLADGEDPAGLAEEFARVLDSQRKQIEAEVGQGLEGEALAEASREDLARLKEERAARLQAVVKRDIREFLYLLATWYRDELVLAATHEPDKVLNQDQLARLETTCRTAAPEKIAAIDRARQHLDRFINEERVFRALFFALAAS